MGQFMINEPGKPPRALSQEEVASIMNQQTEQIKNLQQKNQELETMVANFHKKNAQSTMEKKVQTNDLGLSPTIEPVKNSIPQTGGFVDMLLSRINELEDEIKNLKNGTPIQKPPIVPNQTPIIKTTPIIHRSKSMPEVIVKI